MKILLLITPIFYGGGENQCVLLAKALKKLGMPMVVLNLVRSAEFETVLKREEIEYYTLTNFNIGFSPTKKDYFKLSLRLIPYVFDRRLREFARNSDIIWANGFPANVFTFLMKKTGVVRFNKKTIYSHHFLKSRMSGFSRWLYKEILGTFDRIVGVSTKTAESLREVFPELKDKVVSIPNGIDLSAFNKNESKEELRKILRLPLKSRCGVFVSRFSSFKNHAFLLNVLSAIDGFKMVLLGDGAEFKRFNERANSLGLQDRIICCGFVPNESVPLYLNASDFCLFPSLGEGFSNALVEAMAAGLPTVIFKNIYVVEFGENILVAKDEGEFIDYARRLVYDSEFARQLGEKCRDDAKKLSIDNTVMSYVNLLRTLTEETI